MSSPSEKSRQVVLALAGLTRVYVPSEVYGKLREDVRYSAVPCWEEGCNHNHYHCYADELVVTDWYTWISLDKMELEKD